MTRRMTLANWRTIRANAVTESWEHRRYLTEFGRLPNCPLHRLELEPLYRYLRATETERCPRFDEHNGPYDPLRLTDVYIGHRIGITPGSARRLRSQRHISRKTAERIADHLGEHPVNIWPDYLFDCGPIDTDELEDVA